MRHILAAFVAAVLFAGCGASTLVWKPDQYAAINAKGQSYRATITVQTVSGVREFTGDSVTVERDSVFWLAPDDGVWRSASVFSLGSIGFVQRATPALLCLGGSLAAGGFLIAMTPEGDGMMRGLGKALVGAATVLCASIGTLAIIIVGVRDDYEFLDPDDRTQVLTAIRSDGLALAYASARLRDDPLVVREAVARDGTALRFASERLKADPAFLETVKGRER